MTKGEARRCWRLARQLRIDAQAFRQNGLDHMLDVAVGVVDAVLEEIEEYALAIYQPDTTELSGVSDGQTVASG